MGASFFPSRADSYQWVLRFSGPGGAGVNFVGPNVNHGEFWPNDDTAIGSCYWEFMARCDDPTVTGYVVSDGSGGAHAMLIGFQSATGGAVIGGDICKGQVNAALGFNTQTCDLIQAGEWVHVAIGVDLDAQNMVTVWVNGFASGVFQWGVGTRKTSLHSSAAGALFVGGSDHLNLRGALGYLSAWDTNDDVGGDPYVILQARRPPLRPLSVRGYNGGFRAADFVADYTKPAGLIPDASYAAAVPLPWNAAQAYVATDEVLGANGIFYYCILANTNQVPPNATYWTAATSRFTLPKYRGLAQHPGSLAFGGRIEPEQTGSVVPSWEIDRTCPMFAGNSRYPYLVSQPQTVPSDGRTTLVFEDFSGKRSTFIDLPDCVGETTIGTPRVTVSSQTWQYRPFNSASSRETYAYGVYAGNGICMGVGGQDSPAYLDAGVANCAVDITKPAGSNGGSLSFYQAGPGVTFRMSDLSNMWCCVVLAADQMNLRKYVAGVPTDVLTGVAMGSWDSLRVLTAGNVITVYSGKTASGPGTPITWTQIGQVTDSFNATATKVGITVAGNSYPRFATFRCSV